MKERPILFSGPMVRAILEGRKTQTRRVVKPVRGYEHNNVCRPDMAADGHAVWWHGGSELVGCLQECPYGIPGDRLWVRETFALADDFEPDRTLNPGGVFYRCGHSEADESIRWRPSIFMPRWASRITLEITDVRVQRVQEISTLDAIAEGVEPVANPVVASYTTGFHRLWDSINAKRGFGWAANPWAWALTSHRVEAEGGR